jgi:hypothetical protein
VLIKHSAGLVQERRAHWPYVQDVDQPSPSGGRGRGQSPHLLPGGHLRHVRNDVLEGAVDHRDSVLTRDEQAAHGTMNSQSGPRSRLGPSVGGFG